jgi:DNA-binding CsgD family transcriptional regulator
VTQGFQIGGTRRPKKVGFRLMRSINDMTIHVEHGFLRDQGVDRLAGDRDAQRGSRLLARRSARGPVRHNPLRASPAKKRSNKKLRTEAVEINSSAWVFVLPDMPDARVPATAFHNKTKIVVAQQLEERLRAIVQEIRAETPPTRKANSTLSPACRTKLTVRQLQIAAMVRDGHSNKAIANKLGLSVGTIKVHLHRTFEALEVSSRVQLAIRIGQAPPSD